MANPNLKLRRQGALERLEAQLSTKTKTAKKSFSKIPLDDKDVERVKVEITILKTRI